MVQLKCNNCGAQLVLQPEGYYECPYCSSKFEEVGANLSEEDIIKLNNATLRRNAYYFDDAVKLCDEVLAKYPLNTEANYCALLAKYKIVYLKNSKNRYVATFIDPGSGSLTACPYYRNLPESLKQQVDKVETSRLQTVKYIKKIQPYDVFLSYKSGSEEEQWANKCYSALKKKRSGKSYSVFFAKESLGAKQAGWEPHIYAALKKAKCFILFASSLGNINSDWIKNEWERFQYFQKTDEQKEFIVVCSSKINPEDLPAGLRVNQVLFEDRDPWLDKVKDRVEEICGDRDVYALLQKADAFIADGKFKQAKKIYNKITDFAPETALAWWGLVRCKIKAFDDYDIVKYHKKLSKLVEFNKALNMAYNAGDTDLANRIRKIENAQIKHHDVSDFNDRTNYRIYRDNTKIARGFKKATAIVFAAGVMCFGLFCYLGITNPLKYTVENGRATLYGKNIFFNFTEDELNVDLYKDYPVVIIGDNAFEGSKLKSVSLGQSVSYIGNGAFKDNNILTSVTYSNQNLTIGAEAFKNDINLSSFSFEGQSSDINPVLRNISAEELIIGDSAFENCFALETITLQGCTSIGANAFANCSKLNEITLNTDADIQIGSGAFDGISSNITVKIPTISETLYNHLTSEYSDINVITFTRDAVEECMYFISKITTIDAEGLPAIEKAEELYGALSSEEKDRVANSSVLQNARAVYNVATLINNIGVVTLESGYDIITAEQAYSALTDTQKNMVANSAELSDARAVYDTMGLIDKIGSVTIESETDITSAENAYAALSNDLKLRVSNYSTLIQARYAFEICKVEFLIDSINIVMPTSRTAIEAAERAYNALTVEQKNVVGNYEHLKDAREAYEVVILIGNIGATAEINSGNLISVAETTYSALTAMQKNMVGNYSDLLDLQAAYDVVRVISNIEYIITIDNIGKISAAVQAYDNLTDSQRAKVGNSSELNAAKNICDLVVNISELRTISLESLSAIRSAESVYESLNSQSKSRVGNFSALSKARSIYDIMVEVQSIGTLYLGNSSNYRNITLSVSNMVDILNNETTRLSVTYITVTNLFSLNIGAWTTGLPNAKTIRHDLSGGTNVTSFTLSPVANITYSLVGTTAKTFNITLSSGSGNVLNVDFENFKINTSSTPVDFTNVLKSNINFIGACEIIATGNGVGAVKLSDADITLSSGSEVTVKAGSGSTGVAGGVAINASNLRISGNGTNNLIVVGGDGGSGTAASPNYNTTDYGAAKRNGGAGNVGGAGGDAVNCTSLNLNGTLSIKCTGGNGGNGSDGGNGGGSYDDGQAQAGHGGSGGDGGNGGSAVKADNFINGADCNTVLCSGNGGAGGKGGDGGCARDYGRHDDGGDGGNGGNGGSSGYCLNVKNFQSYVSVDLIPGDGGNGGNGGSGGKTVEDLSVHVYAGDGGNGGNGGICYVSTVANSNIHIMATTEKSKGGSGGDGGSKGTCKSGWGVKGYDGSTGSGGYGGNAVYGGKTKNGSANSGQTGGSGAYADSF